MSILCFLDWFIDCNSAKNKGDLRRHLSFTKSYKIFKSLVVSTVLHDYGKRKNKNFHIITTLNETYIILLWDKLVMSIFNTQKL